MHTLQTQELRPEVMRYPVGVRSLHQDTIEQVIQTMRTHLHSPLSLEDMADIACLSPYYFSRVFHQIVGIPPGEFLATLRLDAAKRLLLTTSLSITDICFEVGYVGLGSFTTRFTQLVGVPPRHLRHLARNVGLPPLGKSHENIAPLSPSSGRGLTGHIQTSTPFKGLIFAGLFPKPIPQASPVRCTLLTAPGPFHITVIPDGCYFLMVAAFPFSENPHTYLLPGDSVQVGIHGPLLIRNGIASEPVDMMLRSWRLTDPPIISALPYL